MPLVEIAVLILIFVLCLWLIKTNFDASLTLLLLLSVLVHKEFFSIYRWDMLPVRVFMLALVFYSLFSIYPCIKSFSKQKLINFFKEPFVALISLFWLVNGLSLFFTENLMASILYFAFQSTVVVLGITLYFRLKDRPERIKKLILTYIYIAFFLTIFGFVQLLVYQKTGFIFGALWNVYGRMARIGSTFWDVNHFGALLASLLPVLGMFVLLSTKWKDKVKYAALFVPMATMLVMTNSRSAWMLAGVALLVFLLVMLIRKWGMKGIYGLILTLALIAGLSFWEYSDRSSPFRKVIKDYFHYRIDSFDAHMLLLQGSFQVFEMYPYLGGGTGGFFEQFSKTEIAPVFFGRDPISLTQGFRAPGHSIWGETLAETGGLGMFSFVLLMCLMLSVPLYVSLTSKNKEKFLLSAGMFASLVGWLVAAVFYSYKSEFFWIIFFLYFLYGLSSLRKGTSLSKIVDFFFNSKKLAILVIGFIGAVFIFWGLGKNHFIPWDEAIYAKIAKNMIEMKDFMVLRWDPGNIWFEKPPLYIWFVGISMKIFGISEFAARLPSAIFGFSTLFVVYAMAKKMFNRTAAFISALVLATTTQFIYYSRASMMDVSVSFFITLALYFYYKTLSENKWSNWLVVGACLGFGSMIKNVVGFLPILIIVGYEAKALVLKEKRFDKALTKNYLITTLSALAIFLPWHVIMLLKFGGGFVNNYFIYHVIKRGTEAIEQKGRPFYWYLIILKVSMRIWFIALLGAFPFALFKGFVEKNKKFLYLTVWSLVIFLFFSLARSKLVWYIIPMYPVLSVIVGRFIERVFDWFIGYFPRLKTKVFKMFFLYSLTAFALFYLFLVKGLVYTGDLTGSQAILLQKKDQVFGLEIPVYVDKIELPLVRFYTEGNYIDTDYRYLKNVLDNAFYDEDVVFITKESRFEDYVSKNPNITLIEEHGDYALGELDSEYDRDKTKLGKVREEISGIELDHSKRISVGQPIFAHEIEYLQSLKTQELNTMRKIDLGLATLVDDPQRAR